MRGRSARKGREVISGLVRKRLADAVDLIVGLPSGKRQEFGFQFGQKRCSSGKQDLYGAFSVKVDFRYRPPVIGARLQAGADRPRKPGGDGGGGTTKRSEGSSPSGASIAPQTCIRLIREDQNHDAVIRIGGEAPRRRPHSKPRFEDHVQYRVVATSDRHLQLGIDTRTNCRTSVVPGHSQAIHVAGRRSRPAGASPVVTSRQSAMRSLRASATIMVLRVPPRASAVRLRYHSANTLSF